MSPSRLLDEFFAKIDHDYGDLIENLRFILRGLGMADLAEHLLERPDEGVRFNVDDAETLHALEHETHALSIVFQLLNLVEENAAAQTRRRQESELGLLREPGRWGAYLTQLSELGYSAEQIAEVLPTIVIEPVLTAHPTEAKRPTVLQIHRQLYLQLVQLENQMWTPAERIEIHRQLRASLERLWRTGEIFQKKPDVSMEVQNIVHYVQNVFPGVIRILDLHLREAWYQLGFDTSLIEDPERLPRIRFGSWVGGDRDGHPLVTADVTESTFEVLRSAAFEVLDEHMADLESKMSPAIQYQAPPQALTDRLAELEKALPPGGFDVEERPIPDEPWRDYVRLMRAHVRALRAGCPGLIRSAHDLASELRHLRATLCEVGALRLARAYVVPVERILSVFGFHLASLDIRQNSAFHDAAVEQLLEVAGFEDTNFAEWSEERRVEFLNRELQTLRPFASQRAELGREARAVIDCLRVVSRQIEQHGRETIGGLIVSMTRSLSDLLVVYLLGREAGLLRHDENGLTFDLPVVPLFETTTDLDNAPDILGAFANHPITRASAPRWNGEAAPGRPTMQVMVGYSDSNKDGGITAAQWGINRAQHAISSAAKDLDVDLVFFHGRGGTPSRGAGPTHRFLDALPHGSLNGRLRVTEQGETIAQKYANHITAVYNLELFLAGVTATTMRHRLAPTEEPDDVAIMERLAAWSRDSYRELVDAPGFVTFFSQATPVDALEQSTIGSRPARRSGRRTLGDLRAIPWVFSFNMARFYLPGWYGLGGALERLRAEDEDAFGRLRDRVREWPFVRNLVLNVETSHASAHRDWMRAYAGLVTDAELREAHLSRILAEFERTDMMIEALFDRPREQRRPRMLKTIEMRDAGLTRLHSHQIALLREWRPLHAEGDQEAAARVLRPLLLTINAIASGLRTTG